MLFRPKRPLIWLAAAFAVLAADVAVCYWSVGQLLATFRQRAASYEVVAALDGVLSALTDAETGQRGFLITGDPKYLEPYDAARANIGSRLDELDARLSDPQQRVRVGVLKNRTREKLEELALTIRLRRDRDFESARQVVAEDRGKRYMDEARAAGAEIQRVERANLASRQTDAESSTRRAAITLAGIAAFNLLLLLAVYSIGRAEVASERRAYGSAARLAAIVQSSDDAIVSKSLDGTITSWNAGADRLFGYAADEVIGRSVMILVPEDRREEELGFLRRLSVGERIDHYETIRAAKGGRRIGVEVTISPLRDSTGRVVGASTIARDVTQRLAAERRLREVNENLERLVAERTTELTSANRRFAEANEQLAAFNYTVSHDLRAPLRGMQGFAQALLDDYGERLDDTGREFAGRVIGAARQMDKLIADLLDYSRLQRQDLPLRRVELRLAAADAIAALDVEARAAGAVIDAAGVGCEVTANRPVLTQVLTNLIGNAIKYVPAGVAPAVRVWCEDRGATVRVNVGDNGIGIAPEHRDRVFRAFERLHGSEAYPGTGIGLAIVRVGAERMGGTCGVEPGDGGGSTIWVELAKPPGDNGVSHGGET